MKNGFIFVRNMIIRVSWSVALIACENSGRSCQSIESDARALIDRYKQCGQGDSCSIVNLYDYAGQGNCLEAFQCSTAIREGSDFEAFRREAQALVQDHGNCQICVQAGCVPPSEFEAFCNIGNGKCDMRLKTAIQGVGRIERNEPRQMITDLRVGRLNR